MKDRYIHSNIHRHAHTQIKRERESAGTGHFRALCLYVGVYISSISRKRGKNKLMYLIVFSTDEKGRIDNRKMRRKGVMA